MTRNKVQHGGVDILDALILIDGHVLVVSFPFPLAVEIKYITDVKICLTSLAESGRIHSKCQRWYANLAGHLFPGNILQVHVFLDIQISAFPCLMPQFRIRWAHGTQQTRSAGIEHYEWKSLPLKVYRSSKKQIYQGRGYWTLLPPIGLQCESSPHWQRPKVATVGQLFSGLSEVSLVVLVHFSVNIHLHHQNHPLLTIHLAPVLSNKALRYIQG